MTRGRAALGVLLTLVVLLVGGCYLAKTEPSQQVDPETGLTWVRLETLPAEVAQTVDRIDRGGPFRYAQDGATFGNRERLLPARPSRYYREYTVPTPGSRDRGARRIVAGDQGRQLFYTADHYASFVRIQR